MTNRGFTIGKDLFRLYVRLNIPSFWRTETAKGVKSYWISQNYLQYAFILKRRFVEWNHTEYLTALVQLNKSIKGTI